jgi:hypothetical protein
MQRWACVGHEIAVLDDEKVTGGVGRDDLEGERAETERVKMVGTVSSGRHRADWDGIEGGRLRFGQALREDILESSCGDDGGGRFEESAARNWHGGMVRQGTGSSQMGKGK